MDALDRKMMMNRIMSQIGKRKPAQPMSPQFMAQSTPMKITGSQPSAAESQAFNDRNKNRALYGKYGKGGIERERIGSAQQKSVAEAAQKAAEFQLKQGKLAETIRANKAKEAGGIGGIGGASIGGQTAVRQTAGPQITPTSAQPAISRPVTAKQSQGVFPAPDTPMMALASGTGGIRVPEGGMAKPGYYGMNPSGQTQYTPNQVTATPPADPVMMDKIFGMPKGGTKRQTGAGGSFGSPTSMGTSTPAKKTNVYNRFNDVDMWGSNVPAPKNAKTIWDEIRDYMNMAKKRSY